MFAGFLPRDLGDQRFELGPPNGNIQAAVCGALQQEDHVAIGIARVMEDNILSLEGKIERSIAEDERLPGDGYSFCADRVIGRLQIEEGRGGGSRSCAPLRSSRISSSSGKARLRTETSARGAGRAVADLLRERRRNRRRWRKIFSMEREHRFRIVILIANGRV